MATMVELLRGGHNAIWIVYTGPVNDYGIKPGVCDCIKGRSKFARGQTSVWIEKASGI